MKKEKKEKLPIFIRVIIRTMAVATVILFLAWLIKLLLIAVFL